MEFSVFKAFGHLSTGNMIKPYQVLTICMPVTLTMMFTVCLESEPGLSKLYKTQPSRLILLI